MKGHYSVGLQQLLQLYLLAGSSHRSSSKQLGGLGVQIVSRHYPRTIRQIHLPGHLPPHAVLMEAPICCQIRTMLCQLFYLLRKGKWRRSKKVRPLADPAQPPGNIHIACHDWNLSNLQSPTSHLHRLHCSVQARLVEVAILADLIHRKSC